MINGQAEQRVEIGFDRIERQRRSHEDRLAERQGGEDRAGDEFDERIPRGDRRAARAAASAKQKPADDGEIVARELYEAIGA